MMSDSTAHIAINHFAGIHPIAFSQLYKYTLFNLTYTGIK